ncbi:MAG: hypothetical protein ACOYPS_09530 [Phycisphaerales bacterium]
MNGPDDKTAPAQRRMRWVQVSGFAIGVCLLAGAGTVVLKDRDAFSFAVGSLRAAPGWLFALLLLLPCLNWLLSAEMLRLLLVPVKGETFAGPTRGEMQLLTGFAWLANYSPVRPGLFFRLWWHASRDGIPMGRSVRSVGASIACGCLSVGMLLACCWMVPVATAHPVAWTVAALMMPPATFVAASMVAGRAGSSWRWFWLAAAVRSLDVMVWMARYATVFALAGGRTLDVREAAAIAAVSQAAMLIPWAGNGLGVREVAIGLAAAWLPSWYGGGDPHAALTADLVNRAGEVTGALVVGSVSGLLLWRRAKRGR